MVSWGSYSAHNNIFTTIIVDVFSIVVNEEDNQKIGDFGGLGQNIIVKIYNIAHKPCSFAKISPIHNKIVPSTLWG